MPLTNVTQVVKIDPTTMDVTVQAYGFKPGEYILVTGFAMQEDGAYATFQDTQVIQSGQQSATEETDPAAPENIPTVTIRVTKAPDTKEFELSKRITVVAQLHWTSVLARPENFTGRTQNTWLLI